ncbi:MAG: HAMP domain-containing histidine kinase, partial [Clostridiales bacterium]|nr:HAMP domain-containing histidine kinase [Clostridiales bacterium]
MIKKLRRRFIAIAMCSAAIVLFAMMLCLNLITFSNVCQTADTRISLILLTLGDSGSAPQDAGADPGDGMAIPGTNANVPDNSAIPGRSTGRGLFGFGLNGLTAESEFDLRYFTVTVSDSGTVLQIDTGKISATTTKDASAYALTLWNKHKTKGFMKYYRYEARETATSSGAGATQYVFLDCERELTTFRAFLAASIAMSIGGVLVVFVLVLLLSKRAVAPVAESYEKQKRFITDASHEIKTPLTIIDANTEVLEMTEGENQWTKSTKKQVARLTSLTERLVYLTRMDEDSRRPEMEDFDLSEAVLDVAEPFGAVAKSRGKSLAIDVVPGIKMYGNEGELRQLVSILLDNAMKYASESGQIRLALSASGKSKILTVYNTTGPIPAGRHDELFERFYRRDPSRNSQTG